MGEAKRRKLAGTYPAQDGGRTARTGGPKRPRYFRPVVVKLGSERYAVHFDRPLFGPGAVYRIHTVMKRDTKGVDVPRHRYTRVTDPDLIHMARSKAGSLLARRAA